MTRKFNASLRVDVPEATRDKLQIKTIKDKTNMSVVIRALIDGYVKGDLILDKDNNSIIYKWTNL